MKPSSIAAALLALAFVALLVEGPPRDQPAVAKDGDGYRQVLRVEPPSAGRAVLRDGTILTMTGTTMIATVPVATPSMGNGVPGR